MAIEVVMPKLGWNMEAGTVVQWLKQDGDTVRAGDMLLLVESDKSTMEVESLDSGILRIPPDAPALGESLPVGTVLAYLVQAGESAPAATAPGVASAPPAEVAAPVAAVPVTTRRGRPVASPRAIRIAVELGVDWTALTGSGTDGRIVERDVRDAAARAPISAAPPSIPPAPTTVAAPQPEPPPMAVVAAPPPAPVPGAAPLSGIRRTIGERLVATMHTVAPVTLTTETDATELVRLRDEIATAFAGKPTPVPTYTDLLARLVSVALTDLPAFNASLDGDQIVQHQSVNIGLAVDTDRGLLVPVIRDTQAKSIQAIAAESARLIAAARAGTATRDDLQGGTFTITNLGMYGIDAFTPIINLPECAILGVGRIIARPVVLDEAAGTIAIRKMLTLSLTFDHRIADGGPAARFLQHITELLGQPLLWLTR